MNSLVCVEISVAIEKITCVWRKNLAIFSLLMQFFSKLVGEIKTQIFPPTHYHHVAKNIYIQWLPTSENEKLTFRVSWWWWQCCWNFIWKTLLWLYEILHDVCDPKENNKKTLSNCDWKWEKLKCGKVPRWRHEVKQKNVMV